MSLLVREKVSGVSFARLLQAEWSRLWKRTSVRLMACAAPLSALVSAKYLFSHNARLDAGLPEYATAGSVPVLALAEMLITVFSGMMLVLAGLSVTEEYRGGQLRMGMLRAVSLPRIIAAKWLSCLAFMFLQLALYFVCAAIIGRAWFPNPATYRLFYREGNVSYAAGMFYNLSYYGLAALALAALLTVFFWIAAVSRSSTAALGLGIGFLLLSYVVPMMLTYFRPLLENGLYMRLYFSSLLMIEWEGLAAMLADLGGLKFWNLGVLAGYGLLFGSLTAWTWRRRDSFE